MKTSDAFFLGTVEFIIGAVNIRDLPIEDLPEFAFIGRSNVGKSSIINALLNRNNLARVSNTPGRTQQLNYFLVNRKVFFVDLPGYGYAKASKKSIENWNRLIYDYLRGRRQLRRIFMLIDARHGLKSNDMQMLYFLKDFPNVVQIVFTKIDKLKKHEVEELFAKTAEQIKTIAICYDRLIATSASDKLGISEFREEIYHTSFGMAEDREVKD